LTTNTGNAKSAAVLTALTGPGLPDLVVKTHQASPADSQRLLFCHEGNWHQVDRIWTIRADGKELKLMHKRTMLYEIAGHEFFSRDGKWVWYDL
jgi:hypothetical protein